jgi:hypothetical protein
MTTSLVTSAFEKYIPKAWPYEYSGTLHINRIAGGVPTNPNVAKAWIETKLGKQTDDIIRKQVVETMTQRGVSMEEAVELVDSNKHLNGFKRDKAHENTLYIEGRQLKAAIKEAASCAVAVGKLPSRGWGATNKGSKAFVAEHICVVEDILHLGVTEPTGIAQRFVATHNGTGIQYEEYVDDVDIDFTVITDHKFPEEQWAMLWLTGQEQGIGATRSQGYGRYTVTRWDAVRTPQQ